MTLETWIHFLIFTLIITSAPGPGNILTINHALQHGWRPNKILILGQETAVFIIMLSITMGTKFLSQLAYTMLIIKFLGVAWLIYSAWSAWYSPFNDLPLSEIPLSSKSKLFVKGFITDITNGKAWVFFMAMVPAYLNMNHYILPQSLILSLTMVSVDAMVLMTFSLICSKLRTLFSSSKFVKIQNRVSAVVFLLLALRIVAN
ncbi:LysE family translocator [Candidatus Liberibacter asiaticus]